jgi:tRNA(Ile)-lysidine synthase
MNITLKPGTYIVAVSGGVDSMSLLHLLKDEPIVKLIVAHFDHGIREDSRIDKQLVKQAAEEYGLPFVYDEGQLGKNTSEAAARDARYKFLRRLRDVTHANAIITAHHQDDVLETAILNWLRGTGRRGYTALKNDHELLRPFLDIPKQEIINYAKSNNLQWREDSTNQDLTYLRNFIRHKIAPQLTAGQRADMLASINDLRVVNDQIDEKLIHFLHTQPKKQHIDRHWFTMLPHDVALEVMAMWLRLNDCTFDNKLLERLVTGAKTLANGKQMDIDKRHVMTVRDHQLALMGRER